MKQKLKIKFVDGKPIFDQSNSQGKDVRCRFGIKCSQLILQAYQFAMPQIVHDAKEIFNAELGEPFCEVSQDYVKNIKDCPINLWLSKNFAGLPERHPKKGKKIYEQNQREIGRQ